MVREAEDVGEGMARDWGALRSLSKIGNDWERLGTTRKEAGTRLIDDGYGVVVAGPRKSSMAVAARITLVALAAAFSTMIRPRGGVLESVRLAVRCPMLDVRDERRWEMGVLLRKDMQERVWDDEKRPRKRTRWRKQNEEGAMEAEEQEINATSGKQGRNELCNENLLFRVTAPAFPTINARAYVIRESTADQGRKLAAGNGMCTSRPKRA
jgi:hypothetical protein